jgi:hypothetical protein
MLAIHSLISVMAGKDMKFKKNNGGKEPTFYLVTTFFEQVRHSLKQKH